MKRYRFLPWMMGLILIVAGSARADDAAELYFDSEGVRIHYTVQGEGIPIVLIHGFTANIQTQWGMPGILGALAEEFKVIAIDNRGHGKSGKPHGADNYGVLMVRDVVNLLDHLEIEKAHVAGYSMGGFITMKMLTLYPERMLSAIPGGAGWSREGDDGGELREELAQSLESGQGMSPLLRFLTPADQPQPTEAQLSSINQVIMMMNDGKALAAVIRGMDALTVTEEELSANRVPTLAIIGSRDPLKEGVDAMAGVMHNLQVKTIVGADHMTAFGDEEFLGAMRIFLRGLRPAMTFAAAHGR